MKELFKEWSLQNNLFLLFFLSSSIEAQSFQNLVPNCSFESYTQCPNNNSQIYYASPWTGPTSNSTDYYNSCSNVKNVPQYGGVNNAYPYYLNAASGNAYAGIQVYNSANYREYLQVKLKDSLEFGNCYYVEFYAANIQWIPFAVNNIAANFSSTIHSSTLTAQNSLLTIPSHVTNYGNTIISDTVKWHKIAGIYEAQGGEKYITIGNFNTGSNTDTVRLYQIGTGPIFSANAAYIFIDSVSVFSIGSHGSVPWSYQDTTINEGDSVFIGNNMGGMNFNPQWFTSDGDYINTNSGITVTPSLTSNYIVQYTLCGVVRSDTVKVTVIPAIHAGLNELTWIQNQLIIYPNPVNDFIELKISNINLLKDFHSISIYNNLGQVIREEEVSFETKGFIISTSNLENGVYFLHLKSNKLGVVSKRFVIGR